MRCGNCKFYQRGYMWNNCKLMKMGKEKCFCLNNERNVTQ